MSDGLLRKYGGPAPRYTSYPTAPHFTDAVDGAVYRGWLDGLAGARSLSLYCHLPFCDSLCWFCGCHTKITRRYEPVARYLDCLSAEADLVAGALGDSPPVTHMHWGGGSPTLIAADDFERIMEGLRTRFGFARDAEIAIEIDPRDVDAGRIAAYAAAGVNRASIGVQDFAPEVQTAINRVQPYEITERAVAGLRAAGIGGINLDLMYGLPHQTVEGAAESAEQALLLDPDRVALFGYAHVPWMKTHQRMIPEAALPGLVARFAQQQAAARVLTDAGYVPVGMDHFARPGDPLAEAARRGTLRRNFQGYTTDDAGALIGLGASAIGALPQGYVQNLTDIRAYERAVHGGHLATHRGVALTADDRARRALIEDLMCRFEADLADYPGLAGLDAESLLDDLLEDGLVRVDGRTVRVTEAGKPFVRAVCARFDAYLPRQTAKHSVAV